MALKKGTEIPTIDVNLVTIIGSVSAQEIAIATATKISIAPEIDTVDAVKLIIKGILKAQKPSEETLTGNTITLTDNVFTPEVAQILQGGVITYDETETTKVIGYTPPVIGETSGGEAFTLACYTARYTAAGTITGYEKIEYPNCHGVPIAISIEDGAFRVSEYTIKSAPDTGVAPYAITYIDALPTVA